MLQLLPKQYPVRKYEGREKIFIIAIKKIHYPSVNLTRCMQILFEKKLTLLRDIKEHLKNERYIFFLGRKTQLLKMSFLPKLICKSNAIPIEKIPTDFGVAGVGRELDKWILKFTWKNKQSGIAR